MSYEAKVIADSYSELGTRLTTMECTFPRFILAEMNTHRDFSRNSASSRAIPIAKMIERVQQDPVIPVFGTNKKGMQAGPELEGEERVGAQDEWLMARMDAINAARRLEGSGVHKQIANRLLEPWLWHTAIITSTRWNNFFSQRCHPDAQPEIQAIAGMMRSALFASTPKQLKDGEWHLPYIQPDEMRREQYLLAPISAARCARVSYLNHDGKRDLQADADLFKRLLAGSGGGHWSPLEHVAMSCRDARPHEFGNLDRGWFQYRKQFKGEYKN